MPALVAVDCVHALGRRDYVHEWPWAANWTGGALILSGPIVVGTAAAEAVMLRRSGAAALAESMPDSGRRLTATRVAALSVFACAAHFVGMLVVFALTWAHAGPGTPPLLPTLVPYAAVAAFAAAGHAVGWRTQSPLAPPMAAVAAYVLAAAALVRGHGLLLVPGGFTSSFVGVRERPAVVLAEAAWFVAVVVLGVTAWSARASATAPRASTLAGVVVAGGAGTALLMTGSVLEAGATGPLVCGADASTTVCVVDGYDEFLGGLLVEVARTRAGLGELGADSPARWVQQQTFGPHAADDGSTRSTGVIFIEGDAAPTSSEVVDAVIASTARCDMPDSARLARRYFGDVDMIAAWLAGKRGQTTYRPPGQPPPTKALAISALADLNAC